MLKYAQNLQLAEKAFFSLDHFNKTHLVMTYTFDHLHTWGSCPNSCKTFLSRAAISRQEKSLNVTEIVIPNFDTSVKKFYLVAFVPYAHFT